MNTFNVPTANVDLECLDPRGGVLAYTMYWRPQPKDPNPEFPGEKMTMLIYLPADANDPCRCGSGKRFGACCQLLPYWLPVCPNPNMQGYSPLHLQSARFSDIPTEDVYAFLQNDKRLYCVADTPPYGFWNYWGDPAFYVPSYGTPCFGDFELQKDGSLFATAASDRRMEVLLDLLQPLDLGVPQIEREPSPHLAKSVRKASGRKRRRQS